MAKVACHGQKYCKGSVGALQRHNFRENEKYGNKEIDLSRTHLNLTLQAPERSLYRDIQKDIEQVKARGNRVQSNSVWCVEYVLSSSNSFFEGLPYEKQVEFFKTAYSAFYEVYGANIKSAVVHFDEHTPHMHLDLVPITSDGRLSAKEIMTKQHLRDIQTKIPRALQRAGFDIERGEKWSKESHQQKPKHLEPHQYKAQAEKEKAKLLEEIIALTNERDALQEKIDFLTSKDKKLLAAIDKREEVKQKTEEIASLLEMYQKFVYSRKCLEKYKFERNYGNLDKMDAKQRAVAEKYLEADLKETTGKDTDIKLVELISSLRKKELEHHGKILKMQHEIENLDEFYFGDQQQALEKLLNKHGLSSSRQAKQAKAKFNAQKIAEQEKETQKLKEKNYDKGAR